MNYKNLLNFLSKVNMNLIIRDLIAKLRIWNIDLEYQII